MPICSVFFKIKDRMLQLCWQWLFWQHPETKPLHQRLASSQELHCKTYSISLNSSKYHSHVDWKAETSSCPGLIHSQTSIITLNRNNSSPSNYQGRSTWTELSSLGSNPMPSATFTVPRYGYPYSHKYSFIQVTGSLLLYFQQFCRGQIWVLVFIYYRYI